MSFSIVDTRGLTAFGGSRLRKLLWTLTTYERPYIWLLPIATALLIYWAPADAMAQAWYVGWFCQWLVAAIPALRFEPSTSPFPQVVQIAVCLAFTVFWLHLALAIVYFWAKPVKNAEGIRRMREAGQSISVALFAGFASVALYAAAIWTIFSSGNDPDVYTRAVLSGRVRLAFFFGLGPFILSLAIVTTVAFSLYSIKRRFLGQE